MTHRTRRRKGYKKVKKNYPTGSISSSISVESPCPVVPAKVIVRLISVAVQTEELQMPHSKKKNLKMPELQSVNRITNLPIVESGIHFAENVYQKIKNSNGLLTWTFNTAENTVYSVIDTATPAVVLLEGPLTQVDKIVCRSLDFVEQKVPSINLPPEMILWNTKEYAKDKVNTRIVRPVLKRADSAKFLANSVLASKYTAFAAESLDDALYVADKYVDKYLPAGEEDQPNDEIDKPVEGPAGKAIHTLQHGTRLSRKLRRRLTKRTLAEVKALKQQSAEAVHVLVYVAEMIATDPKLAFQKGKELWNSLSQDEPENQARPENMEQLIVLLTRESARRMVHLVNYTGSVVNKLNKNVLNSVFLLVNKFLGAADSAAKTAHLENVQKSTISIIRSKAYSGVVILKSLNVQLTKILENMANQLAHDTTSSETQKSALSVPQINIQQIKAFQTNTVKGRNGVEKNSEHRNSNTQMNACINTNSKNEEF